MSFISIAIQISTLFSLILAGFIANKKGIISNALNKELGNVILYITLPALVIKSMQYDFSKEMVNKSFITVIISIAIYIFVILFSYLAAKILKLEGKNKDIIQFLLIFPNVGFMGYPIVHSVFKDIGVFYAALFNMPFDIIIWTLGIVIMCRSSKKGTKLDLKKIFLNPGLPSIIIGYTLFLFSIKLPTPIYDTLNVLGSSTTPLSMILVGSILSQSNILEAFKNKKLLIVSFLRLLLIPFLIYIVLKNVFSLSGLILGVPFIISAMPSAANAAIFAVRFDNDDVLASQGVFITTLLSILTIPILVSLLRV